ncbi:MAG: hypothetical protein ACXVHY_10415 [Methanobacterium sp.]
MKIDELDLIEDVHQIKIKNKEDLIQAILKKAEISEYDVLQLCSIINLWIAQNRAADEVEIPIEIVTKL